MSIYDLLPYKTKVVDAIGKFGILPTIVTGETESGAPVYIFGEAHTAINNSFYEHLPIESVVNWVEHSTVPIDTSLASPPKKGSEWVWNECVQKELPFLCIDNRVEIGVIDAQKEVSLLNKLTILLENREYRERSDVFENVQSILIFMGERTKQFVINIKQLPKNVKEDTQVLMIHIKETINELLSLMKRPEEEVEKIKTEIYTLCKSIMIQLLRISFIFMDAHLIKLLLSYDNSTPIFIYVGLNHAIRLTHWMNWELHENPTIDLGLIMNKALSKLDSFTKKLSKPK